MIEGAHDSETHVKRHMSVDDFVRLEEHDFKWNSKKEFKPRTDIGLRRKMYSHL